jgi:uncharacterized protein (DUF3820 family)
MPSVKHRGEDICDVPVEYLRWAEENIRNLDAGLRAAINQEIARREGDRPGAGRVVREANNS